MNNPPCVNAWVDIPADCRMAVELTFEDELRFTLGNGGDVTVVFERAALERFARLAFGALTLELSPDSRADLPRLADGR